MAIVQETTNESFLDDLKRSIVLTENKGKKEHKPSKTYKPSSLSCIRNMYYMMVGAEPISSKQDHCQINICNSGTDIHVRIQQQIEQMEENGIDCEYIDVGTYIKEHNIPDVYVKMKSGMETLLHNNKLNMNFMCDGIIKYNGIYHLLEIKTESSSKWLKRTNMDPIHKPQAISYSISLGLPDIVFLYVNRDFLDIKSYLYEPTQEEKDEVINKIATCDDHVSRNALPDKPVVDKKICNYCDYKDLCLANKNIDLGPQVSYNKLW